MTQTTWVRRKRVSLKRAQLPLPEGLVTTPPVRDLTVAIESIRLLWLQGRCDAEVRRILGLNIDQFREAKELMRTMRVDRETAEEAFARCCDTHEKFKAVQEENLKILICLYESATKRDPLDDRPYDIRAARRILHDIQNCHVIIKESDTLLLSIKTQLGLITRVNFNGDGNRGSNFNGSNQTSDGNGDDSKLFSSTTIKEAWKRRNEAVLSKARDITPNGGR